MGCVWFMHVYRKIELGYWWEHDDVKKKTKQNKSKINLLNEKCSLVQRGGSKSTDLKDIFFSAVLGLPELPRCSERPCVAFSLFR